MVENLPVFIWNHILLRTDDSTLFNCRRVCKLFNEITNDGAFWIERAQNQGIEHLLPSHKWRRATMQNKFEMDGPLDVDSSRFQFNYRNIVLRRKAYSLIRPYIIRPGKSIKELAEEFKFHVIQGGSGIAIEDNATGCEPDNSIDNCFALSFNHSRVTLFINLFEWGIDNWVMDYVRPIIRITQKVNHRFDCASKISFGAELNYTKNTFFHRRQIDEEVDMPCRKLIQKEWNQWDQPALWETMSIELKDYPSGLRHLSICTFGNDTQFWNGFYGPKFANLEVEIVLPEEPTLKALKTDNEVAQEEQEEQSDSDEDEEEEDRGIFGRIPIFRGMRLPALGRFFNPP